MPQPLVRLKPAHDQAICIQNPISKMQRTACQHFNALRSNTPHPCHKAADSCPFEQLRHFVSKSSNANTNPGHIYKTMR